jgi:DNA-directed RNA polymerase specialized sigma24 family protein
MNPILEYALANREWARGRLLGRYNIPPDDVEDIVQDAMLRVHMANPDAINPQSYWLCALRSAAQEYWRRRKLRPVQHFRYGDEGELLTDMEDRRQDCARQAEATEAMRDAQAMATPRERDAIQVIMTIKEPVLPKWANQRLHHLRKKLRAAAVA